MIVLGIDASLTCTGLAVIETQGVPGSERVLHTSRVRTSPEDGTDTFRARNLSAAAMALAAEYAPDLVGIELPYADPAKARNVALRLARLGGAFEQAFAEAGIAVVQVAAASVGKALGVKGRGVKRAEKKRQAIAAVKLRYGLTVTDDEADAIGVCLAAVVKDRKALSGKQTAMKLPGTRRRKAGTA